MPEQELTDEQAKLFALARAARARIEAAQGAAVVDEAGRSYNAAAITLPHLRLSATELAVGLAAAAGARSLRAGVVLAGSAISDGDREVFGDLAQTGARLLLCRADRSVIAAWTAP